jgi:hypothetical protein
MTYHLKENRRAIAFPQVNKGKTTAELTLFMG